MTDKEVNLNDLMVKDGEVFDESKSVIKKDDTDLVLDNMISSVSNPGIMPGEKLTTVTSDDIALNKEEAEKAMIEKIALEKLRKEQEAYSKMSDDLKLKGFLIQSEYQRFFREHGYELSGQQKRLVKREVERNWSKGKYKKWKLEYGDDVLFELNKTSNQTQQATAGQTMSNQGKEKITSLNSLISPIR